MIFYEGVYIGNYTDPSRAWPQTAQRLGGVVIEDPDNHSITRRMFHPYNGQPPIHCGKPAGFRTYHRPKGYS